MAVQGLTSSIKRSLHEKIYEKRKNAALEVEKLVRIYANDGNTREIEEIVASLGDEFALAQNPNSRKGGLIGLAACAIALGNQKVSPFLENLMKPVLVCSRDSDNRIRYFACESLYNIVKVSRTDTLEYFNELFDVLSKLCADSDPNVRNGSDLLDRLLKDIVSEKPEFDLPTFVKLLRERLYTKNQYTRRFLVQWLNCIMTIPDIDILPFLPEFIEGLFLIVGDSSKEISTMCQSNLSEIMTCVGSSPNKVDFVSTMNIIIVHCQNPDPLIKELALVWMNKLIVLGGCDILPLSSGIISSLLPTLAYNDLSRCNSVIAEAIRCKAEEANKSLMQLISADQCHEQKQDDQKSLPLVEILDVFSVYLSFNSTQTKCAVLRWITHLLIQTSHAIFKDIDKIFNDIIQLICDNSDDVVILTLECMAEVALSTAGPPINSDGRYCLKQNSFSKKFQSSSSTLNIYFINFIKEMLLLFRNRKGLLESRSSFIIRQLCTLLDPMNVFRAIGVLINDEDEIRNDPAFCSQAVQRFNSILMTSPELNDLRRNLKDNTSKENCEFFCCLYKSWCHNSVAAITLCLLTQNYNHCCKLLQKLSDYDLTVDVLGELDKLVSLLESPIFSYLRLQLLECPPRRYLIKTMYSLLMLLPQSESFKILNHRLNSLPNLSLPSSESEGTAIVDRDHLTNVDFDQLFDHFVAVQENHFIFRRNRRFVLSKSMQ